MRLPLWAFSSSKPCVRFHIPNFRAKRTKMSERIRLRHVTTRKRTGCQACKKRRKRCDEGRPVCEVCTRLRLKCTYDSPLKWAATRTLFIERDECKSTQSSASYDFGKSSTEPSCQGELHQVLQRIGTPPGLRSTVFVTLCDQDREILLKCSYRACLCVISLADRRPSSHLWIPYLGLDTEDRR